MGGWVGKTKKWSLHKPKTEWHQKLEDMKDCKKVIANEKMFEQGREK